MDRHGLATNRISRRLAVLIALLTAAGGWGCATSGEGWRAGLEAYHAGRYADAELIWLESLAESEAYGEDDPRLAQSLRMLGNLYVQTGRYEEARPMLERWVEIKERRGEVGSSEFADGVEALAGVYLVDGDLEQAIVLYENALEIRENDEVLDSVALAETLERLASCYDARGLRNEARPLYERAIQIRSEVLGGYDETLPESLHSFAVIQHDRGHYWEAEHFYLRALDILDSSDRGDGAFRPIVLTNLGGLYRVLGRYDEALAQLEIARQMREESTGGGGGVELATTLNEIAAVYGDTGRLEEAEVLHRDVLETRREAFGEESNAVAASFNNLALIYQMKRDHAEAESLFLRALRMRQQRLGSKHRKVASMHNNLGVLYRQMGNLVGAEHSLRYSSTTFEELIGAEHPETAMAYHNLAEVLLMLTQVEEAETLGKRRSAIARCGPSRWPSVPGTRALRTPWPSWA